jgi:hypothetical protein
LVIKIKYILTSTCCEAELPNNILVVGSKLQCNSTFNISSNTVKLNYHYNTVNKHFSPWIRKVGQEQSLSLT